MKELRESLVRCVKGQFDRGMEYIDPQEMGEAIDMIKDLAEAEYYCEIVKSMQNKIEPPMSSDMYKRMTPEQLRDMDIASGRMYYTEMKDGKNVEHMEMRDMRNVDRFKDSKSIEHFLDEMETDVMNGNMTPENKTLMKTKLMHLANKL